ncbi:hypothetical protein FA13DRAFT_1625654, partial [Coprinellus micaceus]
RQLSKIQNPDIDQSKVTELIVPLGVTYEKIGTIQRRLAWPLHKDDTLSRSGRPTGLNIYFAPRMSAVSGGVDTCTILEHWLLTELY